MLRLLCISLLISLSFAGFYENSDVVELNPSNFDSLVLKSDSLWIIEFYAEWCGHCQALTPEWKKAATILKGVVKVGAMNADTYGQYASKYGVSGYPTLKFFGDNKNAPEDYSGQRKAADIVSSCMGKVQSLVAKRQSGGGSSQSSRGSGSSSGGGSKSGEDQVIELNDGNFDKLVLQSEDMWLVEFFAPWCGHCKNLEPHWRGAAKELAGKVKMGAVDATKFRELASRFNIQGFPTIKHFPKGLKSGEPSDYDGGRVQSDIVQWALDIHSKSLPPPEVRELTSEAGFAEHCKDSHQLCVLAILPDILDCQAACRNRHLDALRSNAERYKQQGWGWAWTAALKQPKLEEAFEIGGFGYPALVVFNSRKLKFSPFKGSFSETGLHEFFRALSVGRGSTVSVRGKEIPKVVDQPAWDGKDGESAPVDEIDLSELGMDSEKKSEL